MKSKDNVSRETIKIKRESWKSNLKPKPNREDHYFISSDGKQSYAFGINPKFFSKADIQKIVKMIKVKS